MASLITRLYMKEHKIISPQSIDCRFCLAFIIGMQGTGSTLYLNDIHACTYGNALEQVNGGNHNTGLAGLFLKGGQSRTGACPPEPQAVCLVLALCRAGEVDRVMIQNVKAALHHIMQDRIVRHMRADLGAQHIMRLIQLQNLALFPDQQMAVARTHIKMMSIRFKCFLHRVDQLCGLLRADLSGAVVQNCALLKRDVRLIRDRDQIGAHRNIGRLEIHTDAQRLQRRTSAVILCRIIAQHCEVCHIAARLHALRNGICQTDVRLFCQHIHHRRLCAHQRGFSSERFQRLICHAVAQYNNIFHKNVSLTGFFSRKRPRFLFTSTIMIHKHDFVQSFIVLFSKTFVFL